ncbi:MAG TPA: DUF3857 domain-containing protein, partial [candidate division Zixibacteria bacterium]|nr:DUF3857 domain-containing protein [candidate division Zixibacteria bacterium]
LLGDVKAAGTEVREEYRWTQERWDEYRRLAEEMEEAEPSAKGLIFLDYGKQTLTSDGRILNEYRFAGKVLTQDTKWWGTRAWYIDEGINRIDVLYARSISPDGTVHEYSPDDITFSEPTRGEVFFGQGTAMSLTIPAVDIGSIVEYGYIDEEYAPEDPELFQPRFFFQSGEPAKLSKCEFEVPAGRELFYETFLLDANDPYIGQTIKELPKFVGTPEPVITRTDSSTIYTWELRDVEPLIWESNSMGYTTIAPSVHAGLYPDYSYYHERFGRLHREHIKITPEIDSLARAIVGDLESEKEKIAEIYHWVQRNIRYISVKGALASRFGGHYAQITLDNKYGDCSDKAILFSALLEVVGIRSYPIIVMTNDAGFMDRSRFPFWGGNHAINEVWWDGERHVLDATGNLHRFPTYSMGDCDLYYANYVRGEIVYNPPIPAENNSMQSVTLVELRADGSAIISDSMWFTGDMEAGYRGYFEYMPEQRHEMIVEQFVSQRKAGGRLSDFALANIRDISKPFLMEFSYEVDDYTIEAGNYLLLEVPALRYSFPEIELSDPNFGKKSDMTFMRTHDVTFTLADNYTVRFVPERFELSNEYFDYVANYEVDGNTIRFTDRYRVKKLRIPISDYAEYKADAEKIMAYVKERIFLSEE